MIEEKTTTVLLAGIGGQGTILAADVLARCAMACGYQVKVSEIHGMAQRGGSVITVVRFGKEVHTMNAYPGSADIVVSFEMIEALRNISYLADGGTLVVSDEVIQPTPVLVCKEPPVRNVQGRLKEFGAEIIPATRLAMEAGTAKASNIVLLGALSTMLPFDLGAWKEAVSKRVPAKYLEANLAAFESGCSFAKK